MKNAGLVCMLSAVMGFSMISHVAAAASIRNFVETEQAVQLLKEDGACTVSIQTTCEAQHLTLAGNCMIDIAQKSVQTGEERNFSLYFSGNKKTENEFAVRAEDDEVNVGAILKIFAYQPFKLASYNKMKTKAYNLERELKSIAKACAE